MRCVLYRDCPCGGKHRVKHTTRNGRLVESMDCPTRGLVQVVEPKGPPIVDTVKRLAAAKIRACPLCGGPMGGVSKYSCRDCMPAAARARIAASRGSAA